MSFELKEAAWPAFQPSAGIIGSSRRLFVRRLTAISVSYLIEGLAAAAVSRVNHNPNRVRELVWRRQCEPLPLRKLLVAYSFRIKSI